MLEKDLTSVEAIGLAVIQEIVAFKRYRLMASRVTNPLVRERFLSLAREERSHRRMLYRMLQGYTGEEKPPLPKREPRGIGELDPDQPIHAILSFAIRKEQEAQQFYRQAAANAADPSGRRIFEYLAEFERGHERALQAEFDAVVKYPQWFEIEGPDIMLVGP